mmetsp:Transcript_32125/g.75546  ORF Transcript_32125/g.75546 Transcript_32125/m.75546 type:complete len:81 (-) Transcript_32125:1168-1410(-)
MAHAFCSEQRCNPPIVELSYRYRNKVIEMCWEIRSIAINQIRNLAHVWLIHDSTKSNREHLVLCYLYAAEPTPIDSPPKE